jgi:hypothetical protein
MKCAKSLDELYEEVSEFSLVITTDAALATALNARLDRAIIGHFAMTPKQIAAHVASRVVGEPLYSELKVISTVSEETGRGLKYVHSEIENIKEIRKYTRDVRSYLHGRSSRDIYDSYEAVQTLERLMGSFIPEDDEFYLGKKVAVIGEEFFNDLDKHFIPIDHEPIDIFKDEEYEIETIYEIGNDRQLAENAVDLIDAEHPGDYALVMNTNSPITDAVRAALYRRRLPFINSLNVRDLSQIRDYLQFLTLALEFDTIRVKHVKELFSNYNGFFKKGQEEFLLSKQGKEDMRDRAYELWTVMRDIRSMTFGEVCETVCDNRAKLQVRMMIGELQIADTRITERILNEVKYAVDNVNELRHNEEIPDYEKKGVLIVDCNNSVYIDRPVVIYLGMEQDWNRPVVGKHYLDVEEETDKNVMRLNAILQQGTRRFYCVNSTKGGKKARPSMLFDLLYRRPVVGFEQICKHLVKGRWHRDSEESLPEDECRGRESDDCFERPFSKSTFNNYFSCPRKFLFGNFLTTPEEKTTEFGTLIHSFAEFYMCYPEDVRKEGIDTFVNMISDRYAGLSSPLMEGLDSDKVRKAMEMTVSYIDRLGIRDVPLDVPISSKKHPNGFMVAMNKEYTSSVCEQDIVSTRYPLHGQMDLLWDGLITDYKTGKPSTAADIAKSMSLDEVSKYPEFQAPIYLALLQDVDTTRNEFNLFYAMDNDVTSSISDVDISANVRTVRLLDATPKEALLKNKMLIPVLTGDSDDALSQKLLPHASEIVDAISEIGSEDPRDWDTDDALIKGILSVCGLNDNKSNRKVVCPGIRKISRHVINGMPVVGVYVDIPMSVFDEIMECIGT